MSDSSPTPANPESTPAEPQTHAFDGYRLTRERYDKAARMREAGIPAPPLQLLHPEPLHRRRPRRLRGPPRLRRDGHHRRPTLVRQMGKAGFLTIHDEHDKLQVYVKTGVTDDAGIDYFRKWIDAGDIVGATGHLFVTRTGELTLQRPSSSSSPSRSARCRSGPVTTRSPRTSAAATSSCATAAATLTFSSILTSARPS